MKLEIGQAVHYVLALSDPVFTNVAGQHRHAEVVHVHSEDAVSLHVHLDGHNDSNQVAVGVLLWKPVVHADEKTHQMGTWHHPEEPGHDGGSRKAAAKEA